MTGYELKLLREKLGLTQSQLADGIHVTRQAISKWEKNDVEISEELYRSIVEVLGEENISQQPVERERETTIAKLNTMCNAIKKVNDADEKRTKIIKRIIVAVPIIILVFIFVRFAITFIQDWVPPEERNVFYYYYETVDESENTEDILGNEVLSAWEN